MGKKRSNPTRAHLGKLRAINGMPFYCIECGEEFDTLKSSGRISAQTESYKKGKVTPSNMKHTDHKKKRIYVRDQSKKAKQWESTEFWLCECGSILKVKAELLEVKVEEVKSL